MRGARSFVCLSLLCVACAAGPGGPGDGGEASDAGQQASGFPDDVLVSSGLAVDDTEVFFGRRGGGGIDLYARKVDGTNERLLGFAASESLRSLVVAGDTLYYVNRVSGANRVVSAFPRAGGAYTNLTDSLYLADAVTFDAANVYVAYYGTAQAPEFTIARRARTATDTSITTVGTSATPVAGNLQSLLVDASRLYAAVQNDPNLYAAALPGPGSISVMPFTNGRPALDEGVNGLALAAGKLFLTAFTDVENFKFGISFVDTSGGSPQSILSDRPRISDIVADANHVWWLESEDDSVSTGAIWSAAHDGSNPVKVATGLKDGSALRQNSTAVFAISSDPSTGKATIVKVAK